MDQAEYDRLLAAWWFRPSSANLRLSTRGFEYLTETLHVTNYKIPLGDAQSKILLLLQNKMDSPYYLHQRRNYAVYSDVSIFASKDAMMLALTDNDLERILSLK